MAAAEDLFDALAQLEAELSSADEEALAVGMASSLGSAPLATPCG